MSADGMRIHEPRFSEFDLSEYVRRAGKARQSIAEAGLDAILLTSARLLRYFAGGPLTSLFEDTNNAFFFLLPADPQIDATLMTSSGREGACRTSWVPERRFWGYDDDASLMNQRQAMDLVADVIRQKGFDGARSGRSWMAASASG